MGFKKASTIQSPLTDTGSATVDALVAALASAEPEKRRQAARALGAMGAGAEALAQRVGVEPDAGVRDALLLALSSIGNAAAVTGLVDSLRSEDPAVRNGAIEALKQMPSALAPLMTGLLADPDPDVRIFAVNILESLRHPDVEAWLIDVITKDDHVNVCATAVDLLGEVGSQAAVAPLEGLKARFSDEPYVVFAANLALKRIQGS